MSFKKLPKTHKGFFDLKLKVLVQWMDASYDFGGWDSPLRGSYALPPMVIQTIGFLVENSDKYITVVQSLAEDEEFMNRFTIPKGCIKSIHVLDKNQKLSDRLKSEIFNEKKHKGNDS